MARFKVHNMVHAIKAAMRVHTKRGSEGDPGNHEFTVLTEMNMEAPFATIANAVLTVYSGTFLIRTSI